MSEIARLVPSAVVVICWLLSLIIRFLCFQVSISGTRLVLNLPSIIIMLLRDIILGKSMRHFFGFFAHCVMLHETAGILTIITASVITPAGVSNDFNADYIY